MIDSEDNESNASYWPSVTDLFMTLFIISVVIIGAIFFVLLPKNNIPALEQVQLAVGQDLNKIIDPVNSLRIEIGLRPVSYRGAVSAVNDLSSTVDAAVIYLKELKKNHPDGMTKKIRSLENKIIEMNALIDQLRDKLNNSNRASVSRLQERIEELEKINQTLVKENEDLKRESPTFVIDERRKEFRFSSGSPAINDIFSEALKSKIDNKPAPFPEFASKIIQFPDRYNTIEIVGHTDGIAISSNGNLDRSLPKLLAGELAGSKDLIAGSNNDLGLLRALAIKFEWDEYVKDYLPHADRSLLKKVKVRCYSAGQTIPPRHIEKPVPSDFLKNDARARRIEMRLMRLSTQSSGNNISN